MSEMLERELLTGQYVAIAILEAIRIPVALHTLKCVSAVLLQRLELLPEAALPYEKSIQLLLSPSLH